MTEKTTKMYIIKGPNKNSENEWIIPKKEIEKFIENCYNEIMRGNINFAHVIVNYYEQKAEEFFKNRENIEKLMLLECGDSPDQKSSVEYFLIKENRCYDQAMKICNFLQKIIINKKDKRNFEAKKQFEIIKQTRVRRQIEENKKREKSAINKKIETVKFNSNTKEQLEYKQLNYINQNFCHSENNSISIFDY